METRLYNIFKSKNTTKLTKLIIENSKKVLLDKILLVTIKRPVNFWPLKIFPKLHGNVIVFTNIFQYYKF